jgi:hypothetical protein
MFPQPRHLIAVLLLAGCAQKNEFVEVAPNRPYAFLSVATGTLYAPGPIVSSINGQPPSRWRYHEEYRINPGPTTIRVVAERRPFDFGPLEFTATAGHAYEIRRVIESAGEFAALYELGTDSAVPQLVTRAPRMVE